MASIESPLIRLRFFLPLIAISLVSPGSRAENSPQKPTVPAEVPQSAPTEPPTSAEADEWSHHFQLTTITQTHPAFRSPYSGPLSLKASSEAPTSFTSTLFVGHRLWKDAVVFGNPEESAGAGLSSTHGIAAFPNGEIYRVDDPNPKTNLSRLFVQQDFELGGKTEQIEDGINKFEGRKTIDRITLVLGKFSLNDYLDDNTYSHDPRTQFMNWALMDTGAWDYAADTRGYTWGLYSELHLTEWAFRFAIVQVPRTANGITMDPDFARANSEDAEVEYRYRLAEHPGKVRILGYLNHANMGNYREAIHLAAGSGNAPDITQTRKYTSKYGAALNLEQELTPDVGIFTRIGWNDGATETWAFTEIDRSFSFGASLKGSGWHRSDDVYGLALVINGLSKDHADYLRGGGLGFIVGDGALNYAPEWVAETYYSYKLMKPLSLTADIQYVKNPGYNSDRGSVPVYGLRVHFEI